MTMSSAAKYGFEWKRSESGVSGVAHVVREGSDGCFQSAASSDTRSVMKSLLDMIQHSFLPVGYPASVRPEYMTYQIYDSLQALCSYLRGLNCLCLYWWRVTSIT